MDKPEILSQKGKTTNKKTQVLGKRQAVAIDNQETKVMTGRDQQKKTDDDSD